MAFIHWKFFVSFNQSAGVIVNLLPESHGGFIGIHFFQVTCQPAKSSGHLQMVTPTAAGQIIPPAKFLFILTARTHFKASHNLSLPRADLQEPNDFYFPTRCRQLFRRFFRDEEGLDVYRRQATVAFGLLSVPVERGRNHSS